MSGLPWVANLYNINNNADLTATTPILNYITNNNSNFTVITNYIFVNNTAQINYLNGNNMAMFSKGNDIYNITIDYIKVFDLATPANAGGTKFPRMSFIFDIVGIDDSKTNSTDRRLAI